MAFSLYKSNGQNIGTKQEQIGENLIPFSNSSGWKELLCRAAWENTFHDHVDPITTKIHWDQHCLKETPTYPIISCAHVNFKSPMSFFPTLLFLKSVNDFMWKENIIRDVSTLYKSILVWWYEFIHKVPIHHYLGYDLIW